MFCFHSMSLHFLCVRVHLKSLHFTYTAVAPKRIRVNKMTSTGLEPSTAKKNPRIHNSTLLGVGEESLAISRIQLGLRVVLWRIFTARPPRWGLWYSRGYGNARTYIALRLTSNFDWCDPISWFYEAMQLRLDHTF